MRLAVISDIHGNYAALEAVLGDIEARGVDQTVNLGDVLAGPFDPVAVAERVMAAELPTVKGNHDRWIAEGREDDWVIDAWVRDTISAAQLDWLGALPATRVVDGDVFMCHATPTSDSDFWMDRFDDEHGVVSASRAHIEAQADGQDFPVLLCGHTHVPRSLRLADGRLLVNPGSVGLPFLLGSPDARYAILERRGAAWSVDLIAIPYDKAPAMAQARALGHPGFATALQTGWASIADL